MTKHIVASDNEYEISYEDGLSNNLDQEGFWLKIKNPQDASLSQERKIIPPFDISLITERNSWGVRTKWEDISIIADDKDNPVLFRRSSDAFSDLNPHHRYVSQTGNWATTVPDQIAPMGAFVWQDERSKRLDLREGSFIKGSPLSSLQSTVLDSNLVGESGVLYDFKTSCTSTEEYVKGLYYLIHGGNEPQFILPSTNTQFQKLKSYLDSTYLHTLRLNAGNTYDGHMATLAEAKEYVQRVFQIALKDIDKNYNEALPRSTNNQGNRLCWPGEAPDVIDTLNRHHIPQVYQLEPPVSLQNRIQQMLQAIATVQKPGRTTVKKNASKKDLQAAQKALDELMRETSPITGPYHVHYKDNPLTQHVTAFLYAMSSDINKDPNKSLQENFLLPLYQAVHQKINELTGIPSPNQFQSLRVDEWNNVRRFANHADFVNEQFKNPSAVFIIPDNFDDANLENDERHKRQGLGGLAGPMAPVKVDQKPNGSPIYDLCTLGIPTGGGFEDDEEAAKQEITKHFARLYSQVAQGRTIIVPYTSRGGEVIPAFGTGTFADSPLTAQLRPFIFKEFKRLEDFCNRTVKFEDLDPKYQAALRDANTIPPLPLPKIAMPQLAPEEPAAILGKDLLKNPWLCKRFQEWFDKRHSKLTDSTDEESHVRTLSGRLSTGKQITIYNDKIMLNDSDKMTPEEFRESMRELIQMYIDSYAPGEPPSTRPLGSDEQKAIISQLLSEAKIQMMSDKPPAPAKRDSGDAPEPPAPRPGDSSESASQLRR